MGTLLIETKENSPEKLAAIAGKDTKYYFMAEELNDVVEAINVLQDATASTPLFSKITKPNGFSLVGQTLTINALWEWLLLNIAYSNVAPVVFPDIPLCAEGKKRFVYFVPNSANTFEMISGPEGVIPIAPLLPNEGIYATYLLITDTVIEEPANPNPNNTPSLNAVTTISGESFNPISVLEYGVAGATLYKNIFSMWRYIGAISKYINIKWDDLTTTYDIIFPAKADGSTQTLAMISDVTAAQVGADKDVLPFALSAPTGSLVTGDVDSFPAPYNFTLVTYWISVHVAPTITGLVVDIKKNGTSITSTKAGIDATEKNSLTGTSPVLTTTSFLKGDEITPNIFQVGSGVTGESLKIYLEVIKT